VSLHHVPRTHGTIAIPQGLLDRGTSDRTAGRQRQQRQQRALLAGAHRYLAGAVPQPYRPEQLYRQRLLRFADHTQIITDRSRTDPVPIQTGPAP